MSVSTILTFLRRVAAHNNREWFTAQRDEYLRYKSEADALAQDFINLIAAEIDHDAALLSVADCTYRIYRDTRFSLDKTPYKTHLGIFVCPPGGKKSIRNGYYLHLEPSQSMICAGTICLPSKVLHAVRQSIYDEIDEYRSIVESPEFRTLLPDLGDDPLKTAPKGFPRDWPWIDYLRPRNFTAARMLSDEYVEGPDLLGRLLPTLQQCARFNRFINFAIDETLPTL